MRRARDTSYGQPAVPVVISLTLRKIYEENQPGRPWSLRWEQSSNRRSFFLRGFLRAAGRLVLKTPVTGGQNAVQFLDKLQEFLAVLLYRDKRTKFLDALTVGRVHKNLRSITVITLVGMFDVEPLDSLGPGLSAPFGGGNPTGGEFAQPAHMAA